MSLVRTHISQLAVPIPAQPLEGLLRSLQSTRAGEKSLASYRMRRAERPGVILVILKA